MDGEHLDILNAVLERDAELAAKHLLEHYAQTGTYLVEQLANVK